MTITIWILLSIAPAYPTAAAPRAVPVERFASEQECERVGKAIGERFKCIQAEVVKQ